MEIKKGTIVTLTGHPMSGLWTLVFSDGTSVHIESGHGVRGLAAAFGAREGTGDLMEKITGQEIYYTTDEMGLGILEGFTPVEDASDELIEAYEEGLE